MAARRRIPWSGTSCISPPTDSIDFIKWKLVVHPTGYEMTCAWGLAKPGTNGFVDDKEAAFAGTILTDGFYYTLVKGEKKLHMQKINANLFHLLDNNGAFLVGNGSYSFVFNAASPVKSNECNIQPDQPPLKSLMAFQGRTPCRELSALLGLNKSAACNKIKWYILLYLDSATNEPTYYLTGGRAYKKGTMLKGSWKIVERNDGTLMYILDPQKKNNAVHLLRADDNILLFTDPGGNILIGNMHFSYALNRTVDKEPD